MSLAVQDTIGPRATRISVLVSTPEAEEISARAEAAGLSVSAYLRAQALGAIPSGDEQEALKIFDRVIDDITTRIDQANASLEAALTRLATPAT
jgi:hypothetical protein